VLHTTVLHCDYKLPVYGLLYAYYATLTFCIYCKQV